MQEEIDRLLYEIQRAKLSERRTEPRHAFVRPVQICFPHGPNLAAFSKDMSAQGIGIICNTTMTVGSLAILEIHSTQGAPLVVRSEVRWCDPYGKGWFLVGWKFIALASRPMA
jgi:hypothetical protein